MQQVRRIRFIVISFCLGMVLMHIAVFWLARRAVAEGLPDFRIFYTAGLMVRHGQGHSLYSDELQLNTQRKFAKLPAGQMALLPYNHPPFEAVLYAPLTYLPYLRAYFLWFAVNLSLLALGIHVIRPWLGTIRSQLPAVLLLAPLAYYPVANALVQGQDSIVLMFIYFLTYAALRREKELQAGIILGLGLFKFHLVLPFAFILLLRRRWRVIGGFLVSAGAEFAASWALVGWKQLVFYPRYIWQIDRTLYTGVIIPEGMPNLRGLIMGWHEPAVLHFWLQLTVILASAVLVIWGVRQWRTGELFDSDHWNTGFSIAMLVTFLVCYHGYAQDMSILLLPLLLIADRMLRQETAVELKISLFLMFLTPLYLLLILHHRRQNLFALVLLYLAGCLAASATKAPPTSANRSTPQSSVPLA
jgi:hypothetical protein